MKINYNENKVFKHSNFTKLEYIGKCLLIGESGERVLVIGDLHLGYGGALRASGVMVPVKIYERCVKDFNEVIEFTGKVDKIICLGDLKHEFGTILYEEWQEIENFLKILQSKCKELIIIEGNHDKILFPILRKLGVVASDYYLWKDFAFFHGDKDVEGIYERGVKYWVLGHGHPAITLYDESKKENYKCFLVGPFRRNKIIVVPSFFPLIEGTDPRDFDLGFFWKFNFKNFNVKIVGDNLKVLDFGKLEEL